MMHIGALIKSRQGEHTVTKLVDTHLHIILPDHFSYPWTDDITTLANQTWSASRFQSETGAAIKHAIFMECDVPNNRYKDEARYFSARSKDPDHLVTGVVASCRPEQDDGFHGWVEECVDLGISGFRRILHVQPDDLSQSSVFRNNIKTLGQHAKPFDLCVLQRQLPIAYDLAKACENTIFVLDHCGVPDIAGDNFIEWKQAVSRMAALDNVTCKVSGILAYCPPDARTYKTVEPYLAHILEAFGPRRLVWGSDWPVVHMGGGPARWLNITNTFLASLSTHEVEAIAQANAQQIYGLTKEIDTNGDTLAEHP